MNEEIKTKIEEVVKELDGKVSYHICSDSFNEYKKIEIVYDWKGRQTN